MHSTALEIDSIVLLSAKVPAKDYPSLVHPHPLYSSPQLDLTGKQKVSFDDWKVEYKPN